MPDDAPQDAAPTTPAAPTPQPPRSRKGLWIALAAGGMVLAFILGGVIGAVGGVAVASGIRGGGAAATPSASVDDGTGTYDPAMDTPSEEPSEAAFSYKDQSPSVALKMTGKQCFGSAGCNLTVKVELTVADPDSIPAGASGSITYEIDGGQDGPVIDTLEVTGSQYTGDEQVVQTSSGSKKLSVKITDITTNP